MRDKIERMEKDRSLLRDLAERAANLADRLGYEGLPLDGEEIKLRNMARLPAINEAFELGVVGYLQGREGCFEHLMEEVEGI